MSKNFQAKIVKINIKPAHYGLEESTLREFQFEEVRPEDQHMHATAPNSSILSLLPSETIELQTFNNKKN